ncbi:hypothetical protein ASAP_1010 [Asaia bogorensis]|uniref:Uncharacterized protein n=1 Tax=Asaia bogorensis TaxID=91915 RepID=A0A060QDP9_9PROT|nr:hypothetical protein ASAP_1010 [Asaia bogorensis]
MSKWKEGIVSSERGAVCMSGTDWSFTQRIHVVIHAVQCSK